MVLGAIISIQLGAAVAVGLFSEIGAAGVVFLRALAGALVLSAIWRPGLPRDRDSLRLMLLFGVSLAGVNLCFYESIDRIPLGTAVTLEFIGPLAVAVFTSGRRRDWLWAGLAAIGIVLLTGGIGGSELDPLGTALALGAGFFWGAYILLGKRVGAESSGGGGLALAMLFSAVLTAPFGIPSGGTDLLLPTVIATGIAVGVLSAAIPFSLELEAMRRLPSSVFGVMMSIEPAVAAAVGLVFLGQVIEPLQVVAVLLVVAASAGALSTSRTPVPLEP
jgi:inner membrane transporter RhtA